LRFYFCRRKKNKKTVTGVTGVTGFKPRPFLAANAGKTRHTLVTPVLRCYAFTLPLLGIRDSFREEQSRFHRGALTDWKKRGSTVIAIGL